MKRKRDRASASIGMKVRCRGSSTVESSMKATPSHQEGWLAKTTSGVPGGPGSGCPQRARRSARMWRRPKRVKARRKKPCQRAS